MAVVRAQEPTLQLVELEHAGPQSFAETARFLNPGGEFYMHLDASEWGEAAMNLVERVELFAAMNVQGEQQRLMFERGFALAKRLVEESGLMELQALGMSSVRREDGTYHNRSVFTRAPGPVQGLMWQLSGLESGPLDALRLCPANTVMAQYGKCDFELLWSWIRDLVEQSGIPQLQQGFAQAMGATAAQGIDLDAFIASLAGESGVVLTMDPGNVQPFQVPNGPVLMIPDTAFMLVFTVKDDTLFQFFERFFVGNPNAVKVDEGDFHLRSMMLPIPVPVRVQPTIVRKGPYLILASNDEIVRNAVAGYDGEESGLTDTDLFRALARDVPDQGVGFSFVSEVFGNSIQEMTRVAAERTPELMGFMQLFQVEKQMSSYQVSCGTEQGFVSVGNSNWNMAKYMMAQLASIPGGMAAGAIVPRLVMARQAARRASDMAHVKQIGLGLVMYAEDYEGQLPADLGDVLVSPNSGTQAPQTGEDVRAGRCDYVYLGEGMNIRGIENPAATAVIHTRPGVLEKGVNVGFADGHVEFRPAPPQ
jgi:prepilin-type processing-associated H-X9-DG protein